MTQALPIGTAILTGCPRVGAQVMMIENFDPMSPCADAKIPDRVEIVGELPRNPMGKVLEHILRAQVAPARVEV